MDIHILFMNDSPRVAYEDAKMAEHDRKMHMKQSDGSIDQGIFHVKTVPLIRGPANGPRAIRDAIEIVGRAPTIHRAILNRHRAEWPTLWRAIDLLLGEIP